MDVFIALYRGINVGGKNSVKMESLRAMHERLGHKGVKSYIQSGNIARCRPRDRAAAWSRTPLSPRPCAAEARTGLDGVL